MGEPLSPDRLFDFPMDEPHHAYDFFADAPLLGYVVGEIAEQMVVPAVGEITEQMVVPAVGEIAEQMVMPAVEEVAEPEDLVALFSDDDFKDDTSDGFSEADVWEVNEDWLMAPTTPPPMLAVPPPSVYEVGGPSTAVVEGPSFPHVAPGLPVPPFMIEDLSTRLASVSIGEIGPRVYAVEGQMQVMASQMVQTADRVEQIGAQVELGQQISTQRDETIAELTQQMQALQIEVQQRDMPIQQLQTTVSEMSSQESSMMQCILGLDKRIAALEKRPPGPQ
ncbi:hypothetical protein Tco_1356943 [Tanacetum coccineum]